MNKTLRFLTYNAIGIALFTAVSLCLQVPFFENYYFCLGYIVMAVYCYYFGSLSGAAVGGLGTVVYCVLTNGMRGMPGWTLGNILIALVLGYTFSRTKNIKNGWVRILADTAVILTVTALGILGVKSLTEHLLYAQPFLVRAAKNSYAFVADTIMLEASLPVCRLLKNTVRPERVI